MAYLEDLGCLGTALVELLGGEVDFIVMDGFGGRVYFGTRECEGFGGGAGALRSPIDSNRSFAVTSNLRMFLAAWETFRHIPDFRQCVSNFITANVGACVDAMHIKEVGGLVPSSA